MKEVLVQKIVEADLMEMGFCFTLASIGVAVIAFVVSVIISELLKK
jgi:hypothetical protein